MKAMWPFEERLATMNPVSGLSGLTRAAFGSTQFRCHLPSDFRPQRAPEA